MSVAKVTACDVPEGSLLAEFGGPEDYTDCFYRDVPGEVTLPEFIERFYRSTAFLPERLVLRAIGSNASPADARAVARGEAERFGVWRVVERRETQALLESKSTNTASWFAVEALGEGTRPSSSSEAVGQTRLYFGSWVGNLDQSGWRSMLRAHVWYSRWLLGGV
ncbi:hypothetical protein [Erythrobacter sp. THAF29]|uniref:hypothetical protein n=1 Tax=Erythrobacter sp. THAF29 TaxID=2587851 RepID=UPI00126854A4|nr:hypothetical protein [Erythrobacter sp. THAF29]QFT76645.1 hypothetical protein FIU90_03710 [Erythrobacter sp. THAF29]